MTYQEFLNSKVELAKDSGFIVNPDEINKALMPHQRDAVIWALKGGRRALFESFGLGKTVQELEFVHQVIAHKGGKGLIVLPLGELNPDYFRDGVGYCQAAEAEMEMPTLFDFLGLKAQ